MATAADFERIGNYARMYNKDQNIDRHKCTRIVPMEVLSLGYARTGTLSMQKAFEILGYANPYHFSSMLDNLQDCDMWMELIDAKYNGKGSLSKEKFDQMLGHVSAVTDTPCILFSKELIDFYPDAKIVLVERDINTWYDSWTALMEQGMNPIFTLFRWMDPGFLGRINAVGQATSEHLVGGGKTKAAAQSRAKEEYLKHYAFVRSIAPQERLLEYRLGSGWEPLCEFLGKPVPEGVPFPRINEKAGMQATFQEAIKKSLKNIAQNAVVTISVVGIPVLLAYRFRGMSR